MHTETSPIRRAARLSYAASTNQLQENIVFARVRQQFRAWMVIYAGLVAAIILSVDSPVEQPETPLGVGALPGAVNAPLLRRDI